MDIKATNSRILRTAASQLLLRQILNMDDMPLLGRRLDYSGRGVYEKNLIEDKPWQLFGNAQDASSWIFIDPND